MSENDPDTSRLTPLSERTSRSVQSIPSDLEERRMMAEKLGVEEDELGQAVELSKASPDTATAVVASAAVLPTKQTLGGMNPEKPASQYDLAPKSTTEPRWHELLSNDFVPVLPETERWLPPSVMPLIRLEGEYFFYSPTDEDLVTETAVRSSLAWGREPDWLQVFPFDLEAYYYDLETNQVERYKKMLTKDAKMSPLPRLEVNEMCSVIFGQPGVSPVATDDVKRWLRHPLTYCCGQEMTNVPPWVLAQFSGGPCGLLAPLQGMILQRLLFSSITQSRSLQEKCRPGQLGADARGLVSRFPSGKAFQHHRLCQQSAQTIRETLVEAIYLTLIQASPDGRTVSLCWTPPWACPNDDTHLAQQHMTLLTRESLETSAGGQLDPQLGWASIVSELPVWHRKFTNTGDCLAFLYRFCSVLFAAPRIPGALNLLMSLVVTRGGGTVLQREDFDLGSAGSLIDRHGHCSQELVNLMLVGRATSNLFNGEKALGSSANSLTLKGIQRRALVGYLSKMEALRYCEVCDFLKSPFYPIWVIGGSDHFQVAFSSDARLTKVSAGAEAQQAAAEAFDKFDTESLGFLRGEQLQPLMLAAGFAATLGQESTAAAALCSAATGNVILKTEWIQWAAKAARASGGGLIAGTSADPIVRMRRADNDHSLPLPESLWHVDGQLHVVTTAQGGLRASGPMVRLLTIGYYEAGQDTGTDELARILETKWEMPCDLEPFSYDTVREFLERKP